jgi:hypothetical protein
MKVRFLFLLVPLSLSFMTASAQESYYTHAHNPLIKSLQVTVSGERVSNPYIHMQDSKRIEIEFDRIGENAPELSYSVIHCNADWVSSGLPVSEYLKGYKSNPIYDFANSNDTRVRYNNYKLQLPNEDVNFKISGNYAILIYKDNKPSDILATVCFSVVDPSADIHANVGAVSLDDISTHQQLNFDIELKDLVVINPETELRINVLQNNRQDNCVRNPMPTLVSGNKISYDGSRSLVFPGGNEYRRMEFYRAGVDGFHVKEIEKTMPYRKVKLMEDRSRCNLLYRNEMDNDGRFFVRCGKCDDSETEADYYKVRFTLACDELPNGNVYVFGEMFNNNLSEYNKMNYDSENKEYVLETLLKEGRYDYMYIFKPDNGSVGQTGPIDGNFRQTNNEYSIYVYHRPEGSNYDKLIGVTVLSRRLKK